jgi:CRP-like cAMP-binding protein
MLNIGLHLQLGKRETMAADKNIFEKYCSEEWLFYLNAKQEMREYKAGDYIIEEGEEVKGFFFIRDGKIKIVSKYGTSSEHILRLAGSGKLMGHRGLGFKTYSISAIALLPTRTIFFPMEIFDRLIMANPEFSLFLVKFLASELSESESRMKKMIHFDVRQKIADIVIMLIDAFGFDKKG